MLSGVSLPAVSNVNNPVGLVGLPYVMWSAHFFVTHIQTEKISSWNGPTVHFCCFMLARASTKTFVSRVRKTAKKIFVSRKIRYQGHSLAEVSLYMRSICMCVYIYIYICIFFSSLRPNAGHRLLILEVFLTHNDAPQSVGPLWTSDQLVAETST